MAFGQKRIHMNQWKYPVCIVVRLLQVVKTRESDVADCLSLKRSVVQVEEPMQVTGDAIEIPKATDSTTSKAQSHWRFLKFACGCNFHEGLHLSGSPQRSNLNLHRCNEKQVLARISQNRL